MNPVRILQQASVRPHNLELPALSLSAKYRAFANRLLAIDGVPADAPCIDRARAIVGWIAAKAIHPSSTLHPNGSVANIEALPQGESWATFNTAFDNASAVLRDNTFWYALYPNGGAMLEKLIGAVSDDGSVADNGMLTEYAPNVWRIRSFASFRAPQCTLQCKMAQALLAAIGIVSVDITTLGHDPMTFYDAESGHWLYIDPTFGEMMKLDDEYLSPLDLVTASLAGRASVITGENLPGGAYLAETYFQGARLPAGMTIMTIYVRPQWTGGFSQRYPWRFGDLPGQSPSDPGGTAAQLMPHLGCGFASAEWFGHTVEVRLRSSWPNHVGYQRSTDLGATWTPCGAVDFLISDVGQVRYRSIDAEGFSGTHATLLI